MKGRLGNWEAALGLQEHAAEMLLFCVGFSCTLLVLTVPSQQKRHRVGRGAAFLLFKNLFMHLLLNQVRNFSFLLMFSSLLGL